MLFFRVLLYSALFPRALAGHAIAAFVLPLVPVPGEVKTRLGQPPAGVLCVTPTSPLLFCSFSLVTCVIPALHPSPPALPRIALTFLCTLWAPPAPPLCCFQGTCSKGKRGKGGTSSGHWEHNLQSHQRQPSCDKPAELRIQTFFFFFFQF